MKHRAALLLSFAWGCSVPGDDVPPEYYPPSSSGSNTTYIPAGSNTSTSSRPSAASSSITQNCTRSTPVLPSAQGQMSPFQLIQLGSLGFCPGDMVSVRLDSGTQWLQVPVVAAQPLTFVAPVWLDYTSGASVAADVALSLVSLDGTTRKLGGTTHLNALPPSSNAATLGVATLQAIASVRQTLSTASAGLSRYAGNTKDVLTRFGYDDDALAILANAVGALQSSDGTSFQLRLASGTPVRLDRASLAQLNAFFIAVSAGAGETARSYSEYHFLATGGSSEPGFVRRALDATLGGNSSPIRRLIGAYAGAHVAVRIAAAVAAEPLLGLSALTFLTIVLSPASNAYTVQLGEDLLGSPEDRAAEADDWRGVQAEVGEAFETNRAELRQELLPPDQPATPISAAAEQLLDPPLGAKDVVNDVGNEIWDRQESCADGALPTEISFNPYGVKCPEDECPGGALPTEISYNPYGVTCPGTRQAPAPNPPQPSPSPPQPSPSPSPPSPAPLPAGSNVCFVGAGTAANPADFIHSCTLATSNLRSPRTNLLNCLDANPTLRIPAPVLPDGKSPSSECTRVSNADINVTGCDGEFGALSCWCCP